MPTITTRIGRFSFLINVGNTESNQKATACLRDVFVEYFITSIKYLDLTLKIYACLTYTGH